MFVADYDLTGQLIWPAAYLLGHYIIQNPGKFSGQTILELGSGAGLVGLLTSCFADKVILSDHNDIVLDLLRSNATSGVCMKNSEILKRGDIDVVKLEWGDNITSDVLKKHSFKYIIGSDIVYWYQAIVPLFQTIDQLLSHEKDAEFVLTYKSRALKQEKVMLQVARDFNFDIEEIPPEKYMENDESNRREHLCLLIFRRKQA